ncbi:MAG: hypothetical protein DSY82_00560 [Flavobacteriia bacterium]|nr:MAG: hypothetical protein DSY82_00560 [Flavobacteriia bacterium]
MKKNISIFNILPFALLILYFAIDNLVPNIENNIRYALLSSFIIISLISFIFSIKKEKSIQRKKQKIILLFIGILISTILFLKFYNVA